MTMGMSSGVAMVDSIGAPKIGREWEEGAGEGEEEVEVVDGLALEEAAEEPGLDPGADWEI